MRKLFKISILLFTVSFVYSCSPLGKSYYRYHEIGQTSVKPKSETTNGFMENSVEPKDEIAVVEKQLNDVQSPKILEGENDFGSKEKKPSTLDTKLTQKSEQKTLKKEKRIERKITRKLAKNSKRVGDPEKGTDEPKKYNGLAIAGFVAGLIGLIVAGIPLGILAIVFGAIALSTINKNPEIFMGSGLAKWAIGLGIVDVLAALIILAILV